MKIKLLAFGLLLCTPFFFSSCKTCKGGGWYGDRNLDISTLEEPAHSDECLVIE
ncbi:MAG: hypothetical protein HKN16_00975 [Saprospiraceae bacterium]|nr:hypothetical protein [Saprospiraceae bacterium]